MKEFLSWGNESILLHGMRNKSAGDQRAKNVERKTFYSSTPGRRGQCEVNSKADLWLDDGVDGSVKTSIMIARFINSLKDRQ